ncbi:ferritin-like domain-containing protein [Defluviitalea saccharophila]|jgi:ferritin-like protein|uniref:Ferritin-like domain-containing protein n=1 Tax=Defluviitalea saccharophila TaxID=879970 RepID=A0ABZ2Y6A1_9FIRM
MDYHEPVELLDEKARDIARVLHSLKEEVEAVNWYHQRVSASKDPQVKAILAHNRDEEIEHAVMAIEWLRRNLPAWDKELRTYLFTEGPITQIEEGIEDHSTTNNSATFHLNIGNMKR